MKDLRGKVAFITGGASGIGLGIAGACADAGMKVVIADLRKDHIAAALGRFEDRGQSGSVHAVHLDVTDRRAMAAAADETERVFGKVHVLVNNAGVGIQGPFRGITYADWDFGLAVNLGGVINGLQSFLPRIRAHGEGGHVVNTASLAALVTMPSAFVVYVAAKAAVVTISETIRGELGQENIGVSVLCPGPVRTNIHELARNRPPQFGVGDAYREAEQAGKASVAFPSMMEPAEVGAMVLNAILEDRLYVITHGEWRPMAAARHASLIEAMPEKLDTALVAMLQARPRPAPVKP
ncbi:MAG TPA: SDR family NAD(P)-dependent oxidoreductase [Steroidobacteraceae bacterium]|nr:SDR family NAD(P)-dependent oxidoreductase [Steroidobacteraceae bacterium]